MDKIYGEFVGVDSLYVADVTEDSESDYVAGTPEYLAPVADIAQAVAIGKLNSYYDNTTGNTYVVEGPTDVTLNLSNVPAEKLAGLLGKIYDESTGKVYDSGIAQPPKKALGFRYCMGPAEYRYYWYLCGTFAAGNEEATTKKENVEIKNLPLTYTAIPTTKKFTVGAKTIPLKRVFADTADPNFDPTGWFSAVQAPGAAPTAVALSSIVPADGATGISKTTTIVLTFNNKIKTEAISLIDTTDGDIVAITKSWDAAGKVLTITPDAALDGSTKYVVAVNGVVDIYGQALAAAGKDFTTTA